MCADGMTVELRPTLPLLVSCTSCLSWLFGLLCSQEFRGGKGPFQPCDGAPVASRASHNFVSFVSFVVLGPSSPDEPLDSDSWMAAEVHEQAKSHSSSIEVVQNLRRVLRRKFLDRFQLNDDLVVTDQIRLECLTENLPFVGESQIAVRLKGDAALAQFYLQAFLVDRFQKPAAHFVVNLKNGSLDGKPFFFEDDGCWLPDCLSVHFILTMRATLEPRRLPESMLILPFVVPRLPPICVSTI